MSSPSRGDNMDYTPAQPIEERNTADSRETCKPSALQDTLNATRSDSSSRKCDNSLNLNLKDSTAAQVCDDVDASERTTFKRDKQPVSSNEDNSSVSKDAAPGTTNDSSTLGGASHADLNNKILEQLSLTCQNLKNSVESRQRAEDRKKREHPSQNLSHESASSGVSQGVVPESESKFRPESLSLPRPLQSIEREEKENASKSNIDSHSDAVDQRGGDGKVSNLHVDVEEYGAHSSTDSKELPSSLPSGTIVRKGGMIEFVADNLEEMIKLSSPLGGQGSGSQGSRRSSVRSTISASSSTSFATSSGLSHSPSSLLQQTPDDIPPVDAAAVVELETHAKRVADSLDLMMGNIGNNLHKMSAITIGCEDAYKRSVDITCDSVDSSIKAMYALMAKCEELSAAMGPVEQLASQIKEIKRILDLFESQLSEK